MLCMAGNSGLAPSALPMASAATEAATVKLSEAVGIYLRLKGKGRPIIFQRSAERSCGQPNAMGGREVGGLANMLACHLDLENPAHRAPCRASGPAPHGRQAGAEGRGHVPRGRGWADQGALDPAHQPRRFDARCRPRGPRHRGCDFVASAISGPRPTRPAWPMSCCPPPAGGKGRHRHQLGTHDQPPARLPARPGQARPDWWQLAQVARRMGFSGFDWTSPAEIFAEHAALSAVAGRLAATSTSRPCGAEL
jgi:assimilatory nitrate reductase catalytic subunit